jgi:hypothetical protein
VVIVMSSTHYFYGIANSHSTHRPYDQIVIHASVSCNMNCNSDLLVGLLRDSRESLVRAWIIYIREVS